MSQKKRTYSKETEAAWYAIREFIDNNNCSTEFDGSAIQMNYNEVLCHLYSNTKVFCPFTYSKRQYDEHLRQVANHYYRSKCRARHSIGYQRTDKQAQNAVFASDLGITCKKSTYSPDAHPYYIMLLGVDIDGHNGEPDAQGVSEWLQTTYFEHSYWEPSTHLKGRHGYIKLAYPDHLPLDTVKQTLSDLFKLLEQKRELMGYKASIDDPCGLPASYYWDKNISVCSPMPKISSQEHSRYRRIRDKIERGQLNDSTSYIPLHRSYDDIDKIVNIQLPCSMNQSQCLKLPRFNHTDPSKATMNDIQSFFNLEFHSYNHIIELLLALKKDLHNNSSVENTHLLIPQDNNPEEPGTKGPIDKGCSSSLSIGSGRLTDCTCNTVTADYRPHQEGNTALLEPEPGKIDLNIKGGEKREGPVIVRSPQGGSGGHIDPEDGSLWLITLKNRDYSKKIRKKHYSENNHNIQQYQKRIEQSKSIANKAALTSSFYLHYSNFLGRVPDIQEAQEEYIRLGFNQSQEKDNPRRIQRLTEAYQFVLSLWDISKRGFNLNEWNQVKTIIISQISVRMEGLSRSWSKDKSKVYQIKLEELALIYYAIGKSNTLDSKKTKSEKNSFSYHQVKGCFQLIYGKGCHRAKIAKIFKLLLEAGLIRVIGHYEIGQYGNKYEAITGDCLHDTVNSLPGSSSLNQTIRSDENSVPFIGIDPG